MTPEAALASDVFRAFALITLTVIAAAGAVLAILRRAARADVAAPGRIYLAWCVMVPLILAAIFLGRVPTIVFLGAVSLLAMKEYARATGLYRDWAMTGVTYAGICLVGLSCIVPDPRADTPGWHGLFMTLPVLVIAALLLVPILRNRADGQLQALALAIVGFVLIGWMFGHLALLADVPEAYGPLMFVIFAVEICDIAAYLCGRLLGRHPLRSAISPGKTWEGAAGGLAVAMVLPWALRFSLPGFEALDLVATGLIVGIGGPLGDLAISIIKRDVGVKDMGGLIRGHGGVLDRIDSLIFVAPFFLHYARFRLGW